MKTRERSRKFIEHCPKCGGEYDRRYDKILICPKCGCEGSTQCCIPAGSGTMCLDCENAEDSQ